MSRFSQDPNPYEDPQPEKKRRLKKNRAQEPRQRAPRGFDPRQQQGYDPRQQQQGYGPRQQQGYDPQYQQYQQYPPQQIVYEKKKGMPWWAKLLVAFVVLIGIPLAIFAGCAALTTTAIDETAKDLGGDKAVAADTNAPAPTENDAGIPEFQLGQSAVINGVTATVQDFTPQTNFEGKPAVCSNVSFQNGADQPYSFDSTNFKLKQPSGVTQMPGYIGDRPNELSYGELAPGGNVSGKVCWDVAEAAGEMEIQLQFDWLFSDGPKLSGRLPSNLYFPFQAPVLVTGVSL
ncbi:DUF4352 domain-containing protein [Corynebacterium hindlerae]|uniref:DUF4352 domain-containing protein n=1 Tax=Corynebacterium hindlerae TaxID=699041 RepID=A0A7G5FGU6_9CORY|nr:DUF4352 domain-containing protein [Corynebacterium hindlerae]QMV85837.1 DUF4352 domain-containing protein [Corynebacterium hindlerae]